MSQSVLRGAAALAVLLVMSAAAFSQGVITDIKTQPLRNSETTQIPIAIHNTVANPAHLGWVGALMSMHILDNSEIDVDSVHSIYPSRVHFGGSTFIGPFNASALLHSPFGVRSANVQSVPRGEEGQQSRVDGERQSAAQKQHQQRRSPGIVDGLR